MLARHNLLENLVKLFVSYCTHENLVNYLHSLAKQQKPLLSAAEISEYLIQQFCSKDLALQIKDPHASSHYLCIADLVNSIQEFSIEQKIADIYPAKFYSELAETEAKSSILNQVQEFLAEYVKEVEVATYEKLLNLQKLEKFRAKDIFTSTELRQALADSSAVFVRCNNKVISCYPELKKIKDNFLTNAELKSSQIGFGVARGILYLNFSILNSTNKFLENLIKEYPELSETEIYILVTTEIQTSGIGRKGSWISLPYGDVIMSIGFKQKDRFLLPIIIANLVHQTVYELVDPRFDKNQVKIKWPNDIYFYNAKIAGSLISVSNDYVIYGLGINIAPRLIPAEVPEMFNATINSLFFEHKDFSANDFTRSLNPYRIKRRFIERFSDSLRFYFTELKTDPNSLANESSSRNRHNEQIISYFQEKSLFTEQDLVELYNEQQEKIGHFSYQGLTKEGYLALKDYNTGETHTFINPVTVRKVSKVQEL